MVAGLSREKRQVLGDDPRLMLRRIIATIGRRVRSGRSSRPALSGRRSCSAESLNPWLAPIIRCRGHAGSLRTAFLDSYQTPPTPERAKDGTTGVARRSGGWAAQWTLKRN